METTHNPATSAEIPTDTSKPKTKRRFGKLSAAEISAFPGAIVPAEKKVEPDISYFIFFNIPASNVFGTASEAAQVHDFAYQLDAQAKAKDIGAVMSFSVAEGLFEVVLRLSATGEQITHGTPAANAFTQLNSHLSSAIVLKPNAAGKSATWKAKVNGTTIISGSY